MPDKDADQAAYLAFCKVLKDRLRLEVEDYQNSMAPILPKRRAPLREDLLQRARDTLGLANAQSSGSKPEKRSKQEPQVKSEVMTVPSDDDEEMEPSAASQTQGPRRDGRVV